MAPCTLNLGILAHVDAGKTSLTERLLHAAGVIDEIGSVDSGTTRTDSMALERRRGITIKAAVVSFPVDGLTVNVIDTPGHPDFIAEVERVLGVLDGAVLVLSAVEGVQPQTRVLMRTLQRLRIPTLLFLNKIDRRGADVGRTLQAISARLTTSGVPMGSVSGAGGPAARFTPAADDDQAFTTALTEVVTRHDDDVLTAYLQDAAPPSPRRLRAALAEQTRTAACHPVYAGSAVTGAGVEALMAGLVELLPAAAGDAAAPVSGQVFKIERGSAGEKVAYVRMFAGRLRVRDRVGDGADKVTGVHVFDAGHWVHRDEVAAGAIGKLWGLSGSRVGDPVGEARRSPPEHHFAPPTLETVIVPRRPEEGAALRAALDQLAEQDPLIAVRRGDTGGEVTVSLYGEVQREVIEATLAADYGLEVGFRPMTVIHVERPVRSGAAMLRLHQDGNPFLATVGLRVDPAPDDSGIEFRLDIDPHTIPMYVYKSGHRFAEAMDGYVRATLAEGLRGWQVTDCRVTMTSCTYSSPDGRPATRGPLSTAADFRGLTPIVLMRALRAARTAVCEPFVRARVEAPAAAVSGLLRLLGQWGADVRSQSVRHDLVTTEVLLPVHRIPALQSRLPDLTGGEGVLDYAFAEHRRVAGRPPTRARTTLDPLDLVDRRS